MAVELVHYIACILVEIQWQVKLFRKILASWIQSCSFGLTPDSENIMYLRAWSGKALCVPPCCQVEVFLLVLLAIFLHLCRCSLVSFNEKYFTCVYAFLALSQSVDIFMSCYLTSIFCDTFSFHYLEGASSICC